MVEEFDLLEEVEVQFCDEECMESVWHGVEYSESLFCREKPKSELTVVIKEEGMLYFLAADMKEFAGLCRKHGWYIVSHQRFNEAMKIGMCLMEAGKHAGFNGTKEDTVLIPIPASTRERQRKRFPVVCYYLSEWLGITDGFKTIWIEEDREQLRGKGKDKDILRNLQFTRRYIRGKNVVLLDDVLTTGESFRQLKRKMKQLGALSVIGVFLGKTV